MELVELELGGGEPCDASSALNFCSGMPSLKAEEGTFASALHKPLSISPHHNKY